MTPYTPTPSLAADERRMRLVRWSAILLGITALLATTLAFTVNAHNPRGSKAFQRIASFPIFLNGDVDDETVAEIVAAAEGGNLLIYTDSEQEQIGFVDITDEENPAADGVLAVGGEPTSVGVLGDYALVAVNTSPDFINPSGMLQVIDLTTRTIVRTIDLGGQPDSIAVSEDGQFVAIAIENERDEELGDGSPPQLPAGFLVIIDSVGDVMTWMKRDVNLTGLADLYPADPEPEYVAINSQNLCAVTLQENNHIILVDLASGAVTGDFSCGAADLENIDILENDLIEPKDSLDAVLREPDAVTWLSHDVLGTADEGDLDGGSRGFTLFDTDGNVLFEAGNSVEHLVTRFGHYPENRSENKGNEPEAILFAEYGHGRHGSDFLFVGSERSCVVFVYDCRGGHPRFVQALPTGVAPEGLLAIPERDLFVVACEDDARDDKIRASLMIYRLERGRASYPTVFSLDRNDGTPIPWGALSALSRDPWNPTRLYSAHDSFYQKSRIFKMKRRLIGNRPVQIRDEIVLHDSDGVLLAALEDLKDQLPGTDDFDPTNYVNDDDTVNLDIEGLAARRFGGFWVASEGAGNLVDGVSDPEDRPFESPNLLLRVSSHGLIEEVVLLPIELIRDQFRFGFEGVTIDSPRRRHGDEVLYVGFQRAWQAAGDPSDRARIGRYDTATGEWTFAYYPLETPMSPAGGWVGTSEIVLARDRFYVLERDNQGGPDAAVKLVTSFDLHGVDFEPHSATPAFDDVNSKTIERDLLAEGDLDFSGLTLEKLEGMVILRNGKALIVNDNDGVDDNNGETRLFEVPLN